MSNPFTPPDGPFPGHPGLGFGFGPGHGHGPGQRRALHGARRQARREFFDNLRDQAGDQGFAPPSRAHWLGTDALGRDLLTRVVYGARLSLLAGVVSVSVAVLVGGTLGAVAERTSVSISSILENAAASAASCCAARFDPKHSVSLGDLLAKADQAMYEEKNIHPKKWMSQP